MEIFLGLITLFISTYFLFIMIDQYNKLICTNYKFKFFKLRDELALLVMQGKIDENSPEYDDVVRILNFHISAVEKMSITRVISLLVEKYGNEKNFENASIKVNSIDNKEIARIMWAYMDVTYNLIRRNSKSQIKLLNFLSSIFGLFNKSDKNLNKVESINPEKALHHIQASKEILQNNFDVSLAY